MKTPSVKDAKPDRKHLGPTGPADIEPGTTHSYDDTHPNPGNVDKGEPTHVGPTPTDDPEGTPSKLRREVDKKRAESPRD